MPPEQVVVETPVVQTPVITVVETPVVNPETAPEPDILTKVSQFKLPENRDKIENPPEQPELAAITDPVAKKAAAEAVERMRRGMQADYTKKLEDAQKLVNQSKSWTPQRIQQELLNNPEFLSAAQMVEGTQKNDRQLTQDEYSALTEPEKAKLNSITNLEKELQQMKNNTAQEQIKTSISQKDTTLRGQYADYNSEEINQATVNLAKLNLADVREYVYKATMHDQHVKSAYEMGKLEGQGKLQTKLNTITPTGSTITSNEGVPTKATGESDKAFFLRLGQFRLAQFKSQK